MLAETDMGCGTSMEEDLSEHHRHAHNMGAGSGIDPSASIRDRSHFVLILCAVLAARSIIS